MLCMQGNPKLPSPGEIRFWKSGKSKFRPNPDLRVQHRFRLMGNRILCGKMVKHLTFERRRPELWLYEVSKFPKFWPFLHFAWSSQKFNSVSDVQMSSILPFFHTKSNCLPIWLGFGHVNPDPVDFRIFKNDLRFSKVKFPNIRIQYLIMISYRLRRSSENLCVKHFS